jgi:hypothetical protein
MTHDSPFFQIRFRLRGGIRIEKVVCQGLKGDSSSRDHLFLGQYRFYLENIIVPFEGVVRLSKLLEMHLRGNVQASGI